jgi:hypothetical protein
MPDDGRSWPKHVAYKQHLNKLIDFIEIQAYQLFIGCVELLWLMDKFTFSLA